MIDFKVTTKLAFNELVATSKKKVSNPLKELAYDLSQYAKNLVGKKYSGKASAAGQPPLKRSGKLQKGIKYKQENESAWIGNLSQGQGWYGNLLERGGTYKVKKKGKSQGARVGQKRTIAARPYLQPTFEKNLPKIEKKFGSYLN